MGAQWVPREVRTGTLNVVNSNAIFDIRLPVGGRTVLWTLGNGQLAKTFLAQSTQSAQFFLKRQCDLEQEISDLQRLGS